MSLPRAGQPTEAAVCEPSALKVEGTSLLLTCCTAKVEGARLHGKSIHAGRQQHQPLCQLNTHILDVGMRTRMLDNSYQRQHVLYCLSLLQPQLKAHQASWLCQQNYSECCECEFRLTCAICCPNAYWLPAI